MYQFFYIFLLFLMYSFIGWIVDICDIIYKYKKVVNRGFMLGPICPIYGVGVLLMIYLLKDFTSSPLALFILGVSNTIKSEFSYISSVNVSRAPIYLCLDAGAPTTYTFLFGKVLSIASFKPKVLPKASGSAPTCLAITIFLYFFILLYIPTVGAW